MKKTNNNQTTNSHSKGYEKYAKKDKEAKQASKSKPVKPAKPKGGSFLYLLPEEISARQLGA